MSTPTSHEVLSQVITAFDQGDWTIFDTHPGLFETRQHFPHLRAAFPDMEHVIETELNEGDLIACVINVHGTHQGTFMGIAPTGREVRFMLLWIERIVAGKVIQHWALPDFLSIFRQIGATVQPANASLSSTSEL